MTESKITVETTSLKEYQLASPETHFEAALKNAAIGLCTARGVDPYALQPFDNGTLAYCQRAAWQNTAEELRDFRLLLMFARMLP